MEKQKKKDLYTKNTQIVLASSSETRQEILRNYSLKFKVRPHKVNEEIFRKNHIHLSPEQLVMRIAKAKAKSQVKKGSNEIVIGADQILVCKGKLISKAKDLNEAKEKLMFLSNSTHSLINAVHIICKEETIWAKTTKASLFMKKIKREEIEKYVKLNEKTILKTVGGYKIEEDRMKLLKVNKGSLEDVQGFPISSFMSILKEK